MNLLSDTVYWIAAGIALLAVLGGALAATKVSRTWRGFLINVVVIVVTGALLSLSVGLVLNRQNGWYPTLGDLEPGQVQSSQSTHGAKPPSANSGKVTRTDNRNLPALPSPGQRIQQVSIPTADGKQSWAASIVLPADYFEPGSATRAYPVLMLGHGVPGSPQQWLGAIDIRPPADQVVGAGKIRPFITVIPNITPGGADSECSAGPDGPTQLESWLARDVPNWVKNNLRAAPEKQAWAWLGFSGGAWCGTMLTMLHPDTFGAAISLGGYYRPWWPGSPPKPPASLSDTDLKRLDLVALAVEKPPEVALWIQTSKVDPESYRSTEDFLKAVRAPLSVTAVIDKSGGHTLTSWRPHLVPALTWLGSTLVGFAP